jgi:hypothetical protein
MHGTFAWRGPYVGWVPFFGSWGAGTWQVRTSALPGALPTPCTATAPAPTLSISSNLEPFAWALEMGPRSGCARRLGRAEGASRTW